MATIKELTARLCVLCEELYADEWPGKYTGTREDLRDWLNTKTGLSVDHTVDQEGALQAWVTALQEIKDAL